MGNTFIHIPTGFWDQFPSKVVFLSQPWQWHCSRPSLRNVWSLKIHLPRGLAHNGIKRCLRWSLEIWVWWRSDNKPDVVSTAPISFLDLPNIYPETGRISWTLSCPSRRMMLELITQLSWLLISCVGMILSTTCIANSWIHGSKSMRKRDQWLSCTSLLKWYHGWYF